ncbi:MAG: Ldh family oxidoreductase [Gammaproteobacteria bacterium]|nr:Ldh family oxidoreductase [Gammaproteobacteria bacterium]MBU2023412.1 Ldh family oxidoreductase [Gammaproteobacteria bacterium]
MNTQALTLDEIYQLAFNCLSKAGADNENADAVANTVMRAEQDGSVSHGLFRIPGYVASLNSGKVNGKANPKPEQVTPALVRCHGQNGHAPLAINRSVEMLAQSAKTCGIAALSLTHSHHFAALWPETEALAELGLVGFACVSYMPMVAPTGGTKALFGTNPIAFAWPRPNKVPLVVDMATAAMAMGEVQIAARDGHRVPLGTGLGADGELTDDPSEILKGVLLPFGGHKGSAIAMMVELMAGPMVGEGFSFEAGEADNNDGGPPQGGEFILAIDPKIMGGDNWAVHAEKLFEKLESIDGIRLPGQRRHKLRADKGPRIVNAELLKTLKKLL